MLEEKRETIGSNWTLAYDSFVPEEEGLREALTSTGNGYFCTRPPPVSGRIYPHA
jgi:trehalose/maltose hydrolase-like predicted phosphorylase